MVADNICKASKDIEQTTSSGASLRFLLLGDVGVGKSTFIDTFISTLSNVQSREELEEYIPASLAPSSDTPAIRLSTVQVKTAPILQQSKHDSSANDPMGLMPPKVEVPARDISFITIPGYSSTANPSKILSMTDDYVNHHLHAATSIFTPTISSAQLAWFLISGSDTHSLPTSAFYFVLYELKPVDILYMKLIHERVNLVPVLTKADTLSPRELWVLKKRMIRQLKLNGIQYYTYGADTKTVEKMTEQRQWGSAPFVISTRRGQDGQLFESELRHLVRMCLYERFRHSQEDAARKVIAWRKMYGQLETASVSPAEKIWNRRSMLPGSTGVAPPVPKSARPPMSAELVNPYVVESEPRFTPPLPQSQVNSPASIHSTQANYLPPPPPVGTSGGTTVAHTNPAPSIYAVPGAGSTVLISPPPLVTSPGSTYVPSTSYSPPLRSTSSDSVSASQTRLALIQQATGMAVDTSTRPNEIMDENNTNTVQTQAQGSFMSQYVAPPANTVINGPVSPNLEAAALHHGTGVKVEVPNSGSTYHPSFVEGANDRSTQQRFQQQQRQHSSFILPTGYQSSGAFFIPTTDLYQTSVLSKAGGTNTMGDHGEVLPDIWEAAELGDLATVQRHLTNGAQPDQRNNSRSTLLHRTAWQGTKPYAIMHLLISFGANVNLTNENGNTVLQNVLMKHDDPALIKLLLDSGAETTIPNKEGMNTLEVAALFNKIESAKYLLENDLASSEPESILNALHRARSPDKKAMKVLLKSWQGKDSERKRMELVERLQGTVSKGDHLNRSLSQLQNQSQSQITDGTSEHSFETSKGGDGNPSSAASSIHQEGYEPGHTSSPSTTSSNQGKHMSRFNLKTMRAAAPSMGNIFNRKP
ncbi:Septin-14 [Mortierella polycephala]|uniref:Septin-14 n=1 Tax=Mortierella polycephala TaxID=41804 RepID=A0A9P6QEE5_9FUNG|nr:Septin-14 [Mortierella polycephala]